jgi:ATP-dependent Clp protease protease subunit
MSTRNIDIEEKENREESAAAARDIFVFDRLDNDVTLSTIKRLLKFNREDSTAPINLYINSSGGNGYNADAIIATIYSITAPVNTICLGHALSGAAEVLAAGTGVRRAYEFATIMVHQTLWETDGDITNLEIQAAQGLRFREAQIQLLHRCTGQTKDRIRKDIDRDFYMSAREALNYGLIDEVIYHTINRAEKRDESSVAEFGSSNVIPETKLTPLNIKHAATA